MPSYIVKADPDTDLYVEWSTIVDSPIAWGPASHFSNEDPKRLERADRTGSSSMIGEYTWDDEDIHVRELGTTHNMYFLPRKDLKAFLECLSENPVDRSPSKEQQQKALDTYCRVWDPEE